MSRVWVCGLIAALSGFQGGGAVAAAMGASIPATGTPVLVELFTSEGCSSCPPADRLLRDLAAKQPVAGAVIVPLSIHVDYWNGLGWKDAYSSDAFTHRQEEYAEAFKSGQLYTPQMVVDGQATFVGSDGAKANAAVAKAASVPKGTVTITRKDPATLDVEVRNLSAAGHYGAADIVLAVTEDGVRSDVKRGENAGRILEHTAVVRSLRSIGAMNPGDTSAVVHAPLKGVESTAAPGCGIVVFVQERATKRILAVGSIRVSG